MTEPTSNETLHSDLVTLRRWLLGGGLVVILGIAVSAGSSINRLSTHDDKFDRVESRLTGHDQEIKELRTLVTDKVERLTDAVHAIDVKVTEMNTTLRERTTPD